MSDKYYFRFSVPENGVNFKNYISSMEDVLNGFYEFECEILKSFNSSLDLEIYISDIEEGSIKIWFETKLKELNNFLKQITEQQIDNVINNPTEYMKKLISNFLKKTRNILINFLDKIDKENKEEISKELFSTLEKEKNSFIEENKNLKDGLFVYKLDEQKLKTSISLIGVGAYKLNDNIYYNDISDKKEDEKQVKGMKLYEHNGMFIADDEKTDDTLKTINVSEDIYKIITPNFKEGCKWRFNNGDEKDFFCNINDDVFMEKIKNREISIKDGDMYKVKVETKTFIKNNKIEKERTILEILEIIEPQLLIVHVQTHLGKTLK